MTLFSLSFLIRQSFLMTISILQLQCEFYDSHFLWTNLNKVQLKPEVKCPMWRSSFPLPREFWYCFSWICHHMKSKKTGSQQIISVLQYSYFFIANSIAAVSFHPGGKPESTTDLWLETSKKKLSRAMLVERNLFVEWRILTLYLCISSSNLSSVALEANT